MIIIPVKKAEIYQDEGPHRRTLPAGRSTSALSNVDMYFQFLSGSGDFRVDGIPRRYNPGFDAIVPRGSLVSMCATENTEYQFEFPSQS